MLPYYMTYDLSILKFEFRASQTLKQQNAHLPRSIITCIIIFHFSNWKNFSQQVYTAIVDNRNFPFVLSHAWVRVLDAVRDVVPNVIAIVHCGQSLA